VTLRFGASLTTLALSITILSDATIWSVTYLRH